MDTNWGILSNEISARNEKLPKSPFCNFHNSLIKNRPREGIYSHKFWKTVFRLEDRVDLTKHIENIQRKTKMSVDKGVRERKWDFFDLTKGVFLKWRRVVPTFRGCWGCA